MNKIAIHGLGYVGLTAAVHWARAGWTVLAYDRDTKVIDALRKGTPRAGEFLGYLDADVGRLVETGLILPTHTFGDTLEASVHSIAIPTEKDGEPWDKGILALLRQLDQVWRPIEGLAQDDDQPIVLIESTLTPGTMDKFLAEQRHDRVLYAVCPRRDWFADASKSLETLDRVVGGLTEAATARAVELLSVVTKGKITRLGYREAELTKSIENCMLHSLVMLGAELSMNRPDLDVAAAVEAASGHWRLPQIYVGMCGGRCVPLATKYLLAASGPGGLFEQVNTTERHLRVAVAEAIARRVRHIPSARVLVLGIAYRPDFKDAGLSPGLDVARYLRRDLGIEVVVHDPVWTPEELRDLTGFEVLEGTPVDAQRFDAVFLSTPHDIYRFAPVTIWPPQDLKFVLDAQGTWQQYAPLMIERGIEYKRVGGAGWR